MNDYTNPLQWFGACANDGCVRIEETAVGFAFTSTIDGNDGSVTYTPAEVVNFLNDARGAEGDSLLARARGRMASDPVSA
jgi:hypothetical protein